MGGSGMWNSAWLVSAALILAGCSSGADGLPVPCTTDVDCSGVEGMTICDSTEICVAPCSEDSPAAEYACRGGRRVYCRDDPSLPCTVCPRLCTGAEFCSGAAEGCVPRRAGGEPCELGTDCAGFACTPDGLCSVEQGEPCTDASCDGFCAPHTDGSGTSCLRTCPAAECLPSAGVVCIRFDTGSYCLPTCTDCYRSCAIGLCDLACPPSGECFSFCAPEELNPENFCRM